MYTILLRSAFGIRHSKAFGRIFVSIVALKKKKKKKKKKNFRRRRRRRKSQKIFKRKQQIFTTTTTTTLTLQPTKAHIIIHTRKDD